MNFQQNQWALWALSNSRIVLIWMYCSSTESLYHTTKILGAQFLSLLAYIHSCYNNVIQYPCITLNFQTFFQFKLFQFLTDPACCLLLSQWHNMSEVTSIGHMAPYRIMLWQLLIIIQPSRSMTKLSTKIYLRLDNKCTTNQDYAGTHARFVAIKHLILF